MFDIIVFFCIPWPKEIVPDELCLCLSINHLFRSLFCTLILVRIGLNIVTSSKSPCWDTFGKDTNLECLWNIENVRIVLWDTYQCMINHIFDISDLIHVILSNLKQLVSLSLLINSF